MAIRRLVTFRDSMGGHLVKHQNNLKTVEVAEGKGATEGTANRTAKAAAAAERESIEEGRAARRMLLRTARVTLSRITVVVARPKARMTLLPKHRRNLRRRVRRSRVEEHPSR